MQKKSFLQDRGYRADRAHAAVLIPAKNSLTLIQVGTADVSRVSSRAGQGFAAAMVFLSLLLPGSPLIYYGDEIGMADAQRMDTTTASPDAAEIVSITARAV